MSDQAPILDYASPRSSNKLRLPTRSTLFLEELPGGAGVRITEELLGRGGAIGAMAFAGFVLLVMLLQMVPELAWCARNLSAERLPVCLMIMWAVEATLLVAVVNNTWRKTVLTAAPLRLDVLFSSPLRSTRYTFEGADVADVWIENTYQFNGQEGTGDLHIVIRNSRPLRLFAGHDLGQLAAIANQLRQIYGSLQSPNRPG